MRLLMNDKKVKTVGKPLGCKHVKTIRKQAVQNLKNIVLDEKSPALAQAIASAKLLDEIQP